MKITPSIARRAGNKEYWRYSYMTRAMEAPKEIRYVIPDEGVAYRFAHRLPHDASILDIGCGGGTGLWFFRGLGFTDLTGIDLSDNLLIGRDMVKMYEGDVFSTDLGRKFDAIVSTSVIEHVNDVDFLERCSELLKPNGLLLVTAPIRKFQWYFYKNEYGERVLEPTHLREYPDLRAFTRLFKEWRIADISSVPLRFPLLDPALKLFYRSMRRPGINTPAVRLLRRLTVRLPGYYTGTVVAINTNECR